MVNHDKRLFVEEDKDTLKPDIRGLFPQEIITILKENHLPGYRGQQVFKWLQEKAVQDWEEMNNVGEETKNLLRSKTGFVPAQVLKERVSGDGTRKMLWQLNDGHAVESVLLRHSGDLTRNRNTLCLSTQVGCAMGCVFCATGGMGFERNLSCGEIVGQVLDTTAQIRKTHPDFKINNLVYMGMGEPLLNLRAVVKSIRLLNHPEGQNIGMRRITVSTCGLVPEIDALAVENLDITLAVSLHAPTNQLREALMPINKKYPLEQLIAACCRYQEITKRRMTFEYALIKDYNDSFSVAQKLVELLRPLQANINVIPVNPIPNGSYERPRKEALRDFVKTLAEQGLSAVIREEKGTDIEAACGMLAGKAR